MINASSEKSAARSLNNHYYWWDIINDEWVVKGYKGRQKRDGEKVFSGDKPLKQAEKYIAMFKYHHPMMVDALCSGIGSVLQLLDGQLMQNIIKVATRAEIPILVIHDEVIVPKQYKTFVEMLLQRAFQTTFKDVGSFGTIKAKWSNLQTEEEIEIDLSKS